MASAALPTEGPHDPADQNQDHSERSRVSRFPSGCLSTRGGAGAREPPLPVRSWWLTAPSWQAPHPTCQVRLWAGKSEPKHVPGTLAPGRDRPFCPHCPSAGWGGDRLRAPSGAPERISHQDPVPGQNKNPRALGPLPDNTANKASKILSRKDIRDLSLAL